MNPQSLRSNYVQTAILSLKRAIELPETQEDEDRTYAEVIKLLQRMLAEYK